MAKEHRSYLEMQKFQEIEMESTRNLEKEISDLEYKLRS
jgi:hypothetical protein